MQIIGLVVGVGIVVVLLRYGWNAWLGSHSQDE